MTRPTDADRLREELEKLKQKHRKAEKSLKGRLRQLLQMDRAKKKKQDTRRKIVIGGHLLSRREYQALVARIVEQMEPVLYRDEDRELFGLRLLTEEEKQARHGAQKAKRAMAQLRASAPAHKVGDRAPAPSETAPGSTPRRVGRRAPPEPDPTQVVLPGPRRNRGGLVDRRKMRPGPPPVPNGRRGSDEQ